MRTIPGQGGPVNLSGVPYAALPVFIQPAFKISVWEDMSTVDQKEVLERTDKVAAAVVEDIADTRRRQRELEDDESRDEQRLSEQRIQAIATSRSTATQTLAQYKDIASVQLSLELLDEEEIATRRAAEA